MRATTLLTTSLFTTSLLGLSASARADDPPSAESPEPAPVATEADSSPPTDATGAAGSDNEEFTFDADLERERAERRALMQEPEASDEPAQPAPPEPAPAEPATTASEPAPKAPALALSEVDLRAPHAWMIGGAAVIAASTLAALYLGMLEDETALSATVFGLGGVVGLGAITVGVVMRDGRLDSAGHETPSRLPRGLELKLAMPL